MSDLLAGVLDFGSLSLSSVLTLVQEGKLRQLPLPATSAPDAARCADDQGSKALAMSRVQSASSLLHLPARRPLQSKDSAPNLQAVVKDQDIQNEFLKRGYEITLANRKEVEEMVSGQRDTWLSVIRDLKLKFD